MRKLYLFIRGINLFILLIEGKFTRYPLMVMVPVTELFWLWLFIISNS